MILCLDVGNTQVFGGIFESGELIFQFRRTSQLRSTSDELGVFSEVYCGKMKLNLKSSPKLLFAVWCLIFCIHFAPAHKSILELNRWCCVRV